MPASRAPVGLFVAAAVVLVASFMPWGSFRADVSPFGGMTMPESPFGRLNVQITINAWNGNLTLAGVAIPNWIVVVCAAAVAGLAAAQMASAWSAPAAVGILLSGYGALHLGILTLILAGKGNVGIGSIITLGAFVALLVITIRGASAPASKAQPAAPTE